MSLLLPPSDFYSSSSNTLLLETTDGPAIVRLFDVDRLGLATYFLALLYLLLSIYALHQLRKIYRIMGADVGFDTQKMSHTIVTIHVLLRFIAFGILALFTLLGTKVWYPAIIMLFTLPEYFILSTYLLLYFQWLEIYVFSHDQYIVSSKRSFRRSWLSVFFVLSLVIYAMLSTLYILLILRTDDYEDDVVSSILYSTAFACMILPLLLILSSGYFNLLLLSGFTFSSDMAKQRVTTMTSVMGVWTVGRIARGVVLLLSILYRWQTTLSSVYLGLTIISVLLVSEVLPLLYVLDWSTICVILFGFGSENDEGQDYVDHVYTEINSSPSVVRGGSTSPATILATHEQEYLQSNASALPASSSASPTRDAHEIDHKSIKILPVTSLGQSPFRRVYHHAEGTPTAGFTSLQYGIYATHPVVLQSYTFPLASGGNDTEHSTQLKEIKEDLIANWCRLEKHPNLVKCYGIMKAPTQRTSVSSSNNGSGKSSPAAVPQTPIISVVTEYIPLGTLHSLLYSPSSSLASQLDAAMILRIAHEIATGMAFLHSRNIVHGHLHSQSILIDASYHARINDIGTNRLKQYAAARFSRQFTHPAYQAPELFQSKKSSAAATPASDVFAFSVICWQMMTRMKPHDGEDLATIRNRVLRDDEPLDLVASNDFSLPPTYSLLIAQCWNPQADTRPTFTQITQQLAKIMQELQHPQGM